MESSNDLIQEENLIPYTNCNIDDIECLIGALKQEKNGIK